MSKIFSLILVFFLSLLGSVVLMGINKAYAGKDKIFIVESYHPEYQWDASYKEGLEELLGKKYELEYFSMDTKRLPMAEHAKRGDLAWEKYKSLTIKPKLVILADDAALKFVGSRFVEEKLPVVYLGINNNPRFYLDTTKAKNMTGILERPLLKRSIVLLKELYPSIKKVLILFDTDLTAVATKEDIFGGKNSIMLGTTVVDFKMIENYADWKKSVLDSKNGYDAIIVGLYQSIKEESGKNVNPEEIVKWTSENTPVPPFCFWDFAVGGNKTVGGLVLYGKEMGALAGKMVLEILAGKAPSSLSPVIDDNGRFVFSKNQVTKWKIKIPPEIQKQATFVE